MARIRPDDVAIRRARVRSVAVVGASFVRVELELPGADAFAPSGFDQWVRLFLPPTAGAALVLPEGAAAGWHERWMRLPEQVRPLARNYTVRQARPDAAGWLLDIDVVVHTDAAGRIDGAAAAWAVGARAGDEVGLLDQGRLFDPAIAECPLVLVADESGLPGVEAILRDLPADAHGIVLLETGSLEDRRELVGPPALEVRWCARTADEAPGVQLLRELEALDLADCGYLYVTGETALTLGSRALGRAAGIPDVAIETCAYWRLGRARFGSLPADCMARTRLAQLAG